MQYRLRIMKHDDDLLSIVYVLLFVALASIPLARAYSSFCPVGCDTCQPGDINKCSLCWQYFTPGPTNSCIYDTSLIGIKLTKNTTDLTVTPQPTPTCSNISYNYGQYLNNTATTISSITPIAQGHYQVELIVWIILFNNWSTGYIDFKLTSTGQNYSITQANQVGNSVNYCFGTNIYVRFSASYTHSDTLAPITFNMTSLLTTNGTFGIRDILVIAKLCHSFCQLCTGSTNTTCTACKTTYSLSGTTCDLTCLTGYGPNLPSNVCVLCNSYCLTCNGSATNCSTCQTTVGGVQIYKVEDQNSCVATCGSGYYSQLSTQKCLLCSLHCVNISITGQLQAVNMTLQFLYTFSEAMNFSSFSYSTFLNFTSDNASINPNTDFAIAYTAVNSTQFKLQLTPNSGKYLVNTNICTNILPQASNPVQYSQALNQLSPSVYTTRSCVLWSTPQVSMTLSGQVDSSQTFGTFLFTFNNTMNFTSFSYSDFVFFNTSNSSLNMIANFTVTYTMVNTTSFTLKLMPNPQVYFTNATFCAITKAEASTSLQFAANNYKLGSSAYNAYSCITFSTPKVNLSLTNHLDSGLLFGEFLFTWTAPMDFSSFNYSDFVILSEDNTLINLNTDFTVLYTAVNTSLFTLRLTPHLGVYFADTMFCAQSKSQALTTLQYSQNLSKLDPTVYGQQNCFLWTLPSVNMSITSQVLDEGKYAEFIFTFDDIMNLTNFNYSNFLNFVFSQGELNFNSDFIVNYTQVDSYSFKLNVAHAQNVNFKNMNFCANSNSRSDTLLQLSQNNTVLNPTVYNQQSCIMWTSFFPSLFTIHEKEYFINLQNFNNHIEQITTQKGSQEIIKTGIFAFLMPGAQLSTTVLLNQPIIAENLYEGSRFWGSFIFFDVPPYQQNSNKTKYTFTLPDKQIVQNQNHTRLLQANSGTNFISQWKFDRTGHTGFFIVDAYIQMIMIGVSWLLVLLVWVIKKKCNPKSITLFKVKARVMAFFHKVHEVSFFYLVLAGLMEYRNFYTNNSLHIISIIVASIFFLYYLIYQLKIFYDLLGYPRAKIGTREYHQFIQNYGIYLAYYRFEEYNDKKILTWRHIFRPYHYHTLTFIKKALMLTAVPLFYDQFLWPVSILTFLQGLDIIRYLLTIPYHNFWRNLFSFILQALLFIFFVCSLINQSLSLTIFDSNGLIVNTQEATTFKNSGWVGMIVLFIYNILYILSNSIEFFILLFTKSSIENLTWSNRHSYYQDLFDHFQIYGSYYRLVKHYTDELAYNNQRKQTKTFKGWVNRFHGAEPLVDLSDDKLTVFKEIYERGNLFSTQFDETLTKDWVEVKIQSFKIKDFQRIIRLYNFRKGQIAPKHEDQLIKHQTRSSSPHRRHSRLTSQTRSMKNTLTYKDDEPMLNFPIQYHIIPEVFVADPLKHKQARDNLFIPKKIKNTIYTLDLNPHFQKNLVMTLISYQMPGTDQIKLSTLLRVYLKQYEQGEKVTYRRENMRQQIMIKKGRQNHKIELKQLIPGFPLDWQTLQKGNDIENQSIPDNNNDRTSRRLLNIEV